MRFRIWTPWYRNSSGGIRMLHILCAELRARGHDAGIVPEEHSDNVRAGSRTRTLIRRQYGKPLPLDAPLDMVPSNGQTVNVFPEIVNGNPAAAGLTVRLLANRQIHPHDPGDLVFAWDPSLHDVPVPRLRVPIVETDLFHPRTGPRSGVAYWVGKGASSNAHMVPVRHPERAAPAGAQPITYAWPASRAEMADLLGSVDHLICFDEWTAVAFEATLCGTPVLLRGSSARMKASLEGGYGISTSLPLARKSVDQAWPHYRDVVLPEIAGDVDRFVDICAAALAERAESVA